MPPPRKGLNNHCPEIESVSFWQLADCSQLSSHHLCAKSLPFSLILRQLHHSFQNSGGGGSQGAPPLYETLYIHAESGYEAVYIRHFQRNTKALYI